MIFKIQNTILPCVVVKPVASDKSLFSLGDGYGFCEYHSLSTLRDFSLKQYDVSSPSHIVLGNGNFLRIRYLPTAPNGRPRARSASI